MFNDNIWPPNPNNHSNTVINKTIGSKTSIAATALGPIKATKVLQLQNTVVKLENDSVLTIAYVDGKFKSYTVDGKNKQETLDLIEDYIKKLNKAKKSQDK